MFVNYKMGIVGVVVFDKNGNIVVGILIGGMIVKCFGCVGDLFVIGVGMFVENELCVVFVIGYGEYFICYNVVVDICVCVKY